MRYLIAILSVLLGMLSQASGQVTLVQSTAFTFVSPGTSVSQTVSVTAGNFITVYGREFSSVLDIGVTDNKGDTIVTPCSAGGALNNGFVIIAYIESAVGGSTIFTVGSSGSNTTIVMNVAEYSGQLKPAAFDGCVTNVTGAATTLTTPPLTTTVDNDGLLSWGYTGNGAVISSVTSGFTQLQALVVSSLTYDSMWENLTPNVAGSYTFTETISVANQITLILLGIKPSIASSATQIGAFIVGP